MESLFIKLLNNSISAGWLVLAVLLARLMLKKAPKKFRCALWGLVGLRLALPVRLQSVFSLVPSAVTVSQNIMLDPTPAVNSGISALDSAVNPVVAASFTPEPWASTNPLQILIFAASVLWLAGLATLLLYSAVSWLRLRRRVAESVPLRSNIRLCHRVDSPFVLGIFKPRIYLPLGMDEGSMELVIAHEQAHIRRRDNLTKPLAFLLLAVYWFNPLLWIAYILLCRDMELACDERVLREKSGIRKDYASALLQCSVPRHPAAVCPVAFGEVGVKQRIKSILDDKKPALWLTAAAVVLIVVLALCFLTDPAGLRFDTKKNPVVSAESVDLRLSEPFIRQMNSDQLEELMSARLSRLGRTVKSNEYEGMTPIYFISAVFQDGSSAKISGYSADDENILDIQYKGSRYVVEDQDFADYVNRFCSGGDMAEAEAEMLVDRLQEQEENQNQGDQEAAQTGEPETAESPAPSEAESLTVRYYDTPLTDFALKLNEEVPLNLVILPSGQAVDVVWGSENPEVLEVTTDPDDPQKCTVACIAEIPQGGVKIYAEAGGLRTECTVYYRSDP